MAGLFDHPDVLNCSHRPKIFLGQSITKKKRQAVQAEVEKLSNIYIQNNFKLENMNKTQKELLFNNSNYNPHSFEHNVFCEDFNWGLASLQSSMENSIEDKCKETSSPNKFPHLKTILPKDMIIQVGRKIPKIDIDMKYLLKILSDKAKQKKEVDRNDFLNSEKQVCLGREKTLKDFGYTECASYYESPFIVLDLNYIEGDKPKYGDWNMDMNDLFIFCSLWSSKLVFPIRIVIDNKYSSIEELLLDSSLYHVNSNKFIAFDKRDREKKSKLDCEDVGIIGRPEEGFPSVTAVEICQMLYHYKFDFYQSKTDPHLYFVSESKNELFIKKNFKNLEKKDVSIFVDREVSNEEEKSSLDQQSIFNTASHLQRSGSRNKARKFSGKEKAVNNKQRKASKLKCPDKRPKYCSPSERRSYVNNRLPCIRRREDCGWSKDQFQMNEENVGKPPHRMECTTNGGGDPCDFWCARKNPRTLTKRQTPLHYKFYTSCARGKS